MYKSPIDIIYGQMETQLEGTVLKAVQKVGVDVDKEELIRALQYDRDQYNKGYDDAMKSIVHCKDCKHWNEETGWCDKHSHFFNNELDWNVFNDDDFCSYGERKDKDA